MTWMTIRLELARTPQFPNGSPAHAYMLHLPLGADSLIDIEAWQKDRKRATVRRIWPGEPDEFGQVVRTRGGRWAFSYEEGPDDDEPLFHLETHPIQVGEYITITETDGERLPFKVVSCHP